jgi:hypothetical protein
MPIERATRNRVVGFRVTEDEHERLCRHAYGDGRTLTGMLRNLVAERVVGFGSSKLERRTEWQKNEQ